LPDERAVEEMRALVRRIMEEKLKALDARLKALEERILQATTGK